MPLSNVIILATFLAPEDIGTNPQAMLWMFPLLASIAIVYKVTKLRAIRWKAFLKEVGTLFAVLSGFMLLAIVVLNLIVWLLTS